MAAQPAGSLGIEDFRRQQVDLDAADAVARRQDQGALDDVAKLADVARPVMRLKRGHRLARQLGRLDAAFGGETGEEVVDQLRDILAPFLSGGMRTGTTFRR